MKILIILMLSMNCFNALSECEDKNFYLTHPRLPEIKMTHQGALEHSYAHALSNLINIEFSKDLSQDVNPYWISSIHKKRLLHWNPRSLEHSTLPWAYKDLKKIGSCDQRYIDDAIEILKNGTYISDDQLFFLLTQFFKVKRTRGIKSEKNFAKVIKRLLNVLPKRADPELSYKWDEKTIQTILHPLRSSTKGKSLIGYLNKHVFKDCKKNITQDYNQTLTYSGRGKESNHTLSNRIHQSLQADHPVAIGHCSGIYENQSLVIERKKRIHKVLDARCIPQYAVIVGSRSFFGSCQYLLRNSLGSGFWGKKRTCFCENTKTNNLEKCYYSQYKPEHKVLGCWFEKDQLLNNTFEISSFTN